VFIAAVIARNSWTSEISLVGHENTVEVAAYNPHIFLRNPAAPVATSNICSVVALGADDRSVSIWQTKSARPIIVAKEVFERQIMDLSWSWDGLTLYAVSSDGTLAAFAFESDELEGIASHSIQQQYLQKFGFTLPPVPEGWSHTNILLPSSGQRITPPPSPNRSSKQPHGLNGFGAPSTGTGHEVVNTLIAKRNTKRRPQQQFLGPLGGSSSPAGLANSSAFRDSPARAHSRTHPATSVISSGPMSQPSTSAHSLDRHSLDHTSPDTVTEVPIDSLGATSSTGAKRKLSLLDMPDDRPTKTRTLGGDRVRDSDMNVVKEICPIVDVVPGSPEIKGGNILAVPPTLTYLSLKVADAGDDILECKNSESGDQTEICYISGKTVCWLDYLPSPCVVLGATSTFCAAGMLDGTLNIYSPTGRRLMPTIILEGTATLLSAAKSALVAITSTGMLYSWNIRKACANFAPTSVRPLLSPNGSARGTTISITSLIARPNGSPIVCATTGVTYSYDSHLCSFVKLSEPWWAEGSDAWSSRPRNSGSQQAVVASIESAISECITPSPGTTQRPPWWTSALTLGHLESKLHAARVLDSSMEYKQVLLVYAKKIADEGFRNKAEELIKDLFGPIYWRPGSSKEDTWNPGLLGHWKRDLLKEVLQVFARSKTLAKLGMDWLEMLKRATSDD